MTYEIIATGSGGNAVVINGNILIDCGVPYHKLRNAGIVKDLRLVLLTHIHGDHFNPATVRTLRLERPTLRWGCCEWMVEALLGSGVNERMIDIAEPVEPGTGQESVMLYDDFALISPVPVPHNVPNCGWRIYTQQEQLFYATDCGTLDGIEAKNYDLYMIEANHTRAEIEARIAAKHAAGQFSYETAAAQNHLSQEQAEDWLYRNMGPNSRYVFLHQHRERGKDAQ